MVNLLKYEVLDKIKEIKPEYVMIVSNQGGIESGFISESDFSTKIECICRTIREYCHCICYAMYCVTNDKQTSCPRF